jgi:hypothetical protein
METTPRKWGVLLLVCEWQSATESAASGLVDALSNSVDFVLSGHIKGGAFGIDKPNCG